VAPYPGVQRNSLFLLAFLFAQDLGHAEAAFFYGGVQHFFYLIVPLQEPQGFGEVHDLGDKKYGGEQIGRAESDLEGINAVNEAGNVQNEKHQADTFHASLLFRQGKRPATFIPNPLTLERNSKAELRSDRDSALLPGKIMNAIRRVGEGFLTQEAGVTSEITGPQREGILEFGMPAGSDPEDDSFGSRPLKETNGVDPFSGQSYSIFRSMTISRSPMNSRVNS
jgi:hypothetical protein